MNGMLSFDSPILPVEIEWNDVGITRIHFVARRREARGDAPPVIRRFATALAAYLRGDSTSLPDVPLDETRLSPFARKTYRALCAVPRGETVSYGELARRVGSPGSARAIGRTVGANPFGIYVPCHRVVASSGALTGFSATGGLKTKAALLKLEGVR